MGSLTCIYSLPPNSIPGPEYGGDGPKYADPSLPIATEARIAGSTVVRCFIARDIHTPADAPRKRSCHSAPLCIKIRIEAVATLLDFLNKIETPRARLDIGKESDEAVEITVDYFKIQNSTDEQIRISKIAESLDSRSNANVSVFVTSTQARTFESQV
jgi:hypothetical protein